MGAEARCRATIDGKALEGKALLETSQLVFSAGRGQPRVVIAFGDIRRAAASDGTLEIVFDAGASPPRTARFELGPAAAKWLHKITNPPSRMDKLGVKAGMKVVLAGVVDAAFEAELRAAGVEPATRLGRGADLVFLAAETRDALARLPRAREAIAPAGAIWVIRPKGVDAITEAEVLAAGKAAALVDVKVAAFSKTHTAEKLVIPVKQR